jgi:hypothetical protein
MYGAAKRLAATISFNTLLDFPPNNLRFWLTPWSVLQDGTVREIINAQIFCTKATTPHHKQPRQKTQKSQTNVTTNSKGSSKPKPVQYSSFKQMAEVACFKTQVPLPPHDSCHPLELLAQAISKQH